MRHQAVWVRNAVLSVGFLASGGLLGRVLGGPFTTNGTQPVIAHPLITSTDCRGCHGYDYDPDHLIEPGDTWAGTMMAQSGRDPLFWAALDVANHDEPGIGDFCIRCHAPGAWLAGRSEPPGGLTDGCGLVGEIDNSYSTDFDGVTCHLCHRMMVNPAPPPGQLPNYVENGQIWVDDGTCDGQGEPCRRGPYDYQPGDPTPPHPYQYSSYHEGSDFCGSCHNVSNPGRNLLVNGVNQGIPFPLEKTHKEWTLSDYSVAGPSAATCQACHMPESGVTGAYACVFYSNDRTGALPVHRFAGGNAWIPEVLRQIYVNLGLDIEFSAARDAAVDMLSNHSAIVQVVAPPAAIAGVPLPVQVKVTNLTGHKLPTGYGEGRRMWLHVEARDGNGTLFWESGAYNATTGTLTQDAAIKLYRVDQGIWNLNGNSSCDAADGLGAPVFHFARNDCIAYDNRIPPLGFRGIADLETKPVGYSYPETSPGSGILVNYDTTAYSIPVPPGTVSPVTVTATLRYQTTSKQYVEFLRDESVTHNFPDDCINRSTGPATQTRGEILYDLWLTYGRSNPVAMDAASGVTVLAAPPSPGEASGSGSVAMRVTAFDQLSGNVTISYDPACGSTDHTVYTGSLASLSAMTFSQRTCNRGISGTTSFTLGSGNLFWVIVGNDGAKEGSYGTNKAGVERPEDTGASACNLPQDLATRCDP